MNVLSHYETRHGDIAPASNDARNGHKRAKPIEQGFNACKPHDEHKSDQMYTILMFPLLYLYRGRYNKKEQDVVRVLSDLELH